MATVPRYGQLQVSTRQLPGVRRTAAPTATSLGAGVEREREATAMRVAGVAADVAGTAFNWRADVMERERKRADSIKLLEAENGLDEWETKYLYGDGSSTTGVLAIQGKDAMGLPEQSTAEFDAISSSIAATLSTDEQRAAFATLVANRRQNLGMTVGRHTSGQIQAYEKAELTSYLQNKTNEAIVNGLDPRRSESAVVDLTAAIRRHGPSQGMGQEAIDAAVAEATSNVRVGVVNRMIANNNMPAARAYFEETKDQIDGRQLDAVEKALRAGTVAEQSAAVAAEVVAIGGTLTEQRALAREKLKGQPTDVIDETMRRLDYEQSVRDGEDRREHSDLLDRAFNALDANPKADPRTVIDSVSWSKMSGPEKSAAYSYAEARVKGIPVETNYVRWYGLMQQAGTSPEAFARVNLLQFKGELGETEFKQLASMQVSIKNGGSSSNTPEFASFSTKSEIARNALALYGINPDNDPKMVARLYQLMDQRALTLGADAKPSSADWQTFADQILSEEVTVRKSGVFDGLIDWWNGTPVTAPLISDQVTYDTIPEADRRRLEDGLRRRNMLPGGRAGQEAVTNAYRLYVIERRSGAR